MFFKWIHQPHDYHNRTKFENRQSILILQLFDSACEARWVLVSLSEPSMQWAFCLWLCKQVSFMRNRLSFSALPACLKLFLGRNRMSKVGTTQQRPLASKVLCLFDLGFVTRSVGVDTQPRCFGVKARRVTITNSQ